MKISYPEWLQLAIAIEMQVKALQGQIDSQLRLMGSEYEERAEKNLENLREDLRDAESAKEKVNAIRP